MGQRGLGRRGGSRELECEHVRSGEEAAAEAGLECEEEPKQERDQHELARSEEVRQRGCTRGLERREGVDGCTLVVGDDDDQGRYRERGTQGGTVGKEW